MTPWSNWRFHQAAPGGQGRAQRRGEQERAFLDPIVAGAECPVGGDLRARPGKVLLELGREAALRFLEAEYAKIVALQVARPAEGVREARGLGLLLRHFHRVEAAQLVLK